MYLVLYLLAAVLLLLAALSVASPRVNLLAAGLLAWVLVPLLGCLGLG
jgi:hypothetical protein